MRNNSPSILTLLFSLLWTRAGAADDYYVGCLKGSGGDSTNGARKGYHSPGPTDTYLPDCKNPLRRELWRVFEKEDGTAYMIPRPDNMGPKYDLCAALDVGVKFRQYGLCNGAADPSVINSMDPADALQIANALHRWLIFEIVDVDDDGNDDHPTARIDPWVPDIDILDACDFLSSSSSSPFSANDDRVIAAALAYCRELANVNESGIEIAIVPSRESIEAIVPALNEIYGVASGGDECAPDEWGTSNCPMAKCAAAPRGCEYRSHPVVNSVRDCCPKLCYAIDISNGNECDFEDDNSSPAADAATSVVEAFSSSGCIFLSVALSALFCGDLFPGI